MTKPDPSTEKTPNTKPVINNNDLVVDFRRRGGKLLHIRPQEGRSRGLTCAFIVRSGRVELATGVQHRGDDFTKKIGTKTAIEHFNEGKTIFLPVNGRKVTMTALETALIGLL